MTGDNDNGNGRPVGIPGARPWAGDDQPTAAAEPALKVNLDAPVELTDELPDDILPPAPAPVRRQQRQYDWPYIKRLYVEGEPDKDGDQVTRWPSLEEIADRLDLTPSHVREKSAKEGWVGARAAHQRQTEQVRLEARARALARTATDVENRALTAAKNGLALCLAMLEQQGARVQAARSENAGNPAAELGIRSDEQVKLAQAVDLWHKIALRAIGDPEMHRVEITGPNGRPIQITEELKRDDPNRLSVVLGVLEQAGLGELFGQGGSAGRSPGAIVAADGGQAAADAD